MQCAAQFDKIQAHCSCSGTVHDFSTDNYKSQYSGSFLSIRGTADGSFGPKIRTHAETKHVATIVPGD